MKYHEQKKLIIISYNNYFGFLFQRASCPPSWGGQEQEAERSHFNCAQEVENKSARSGGGGYKPSKPDPSAGFPPARLHLLEVPNKVQRGCSNTGAY